MARLLGLLLLAAVTACGNISRKDGSDGGLADDAAPVDAVVDAMPMAELSVNMAMHDFGMVTVDTQSPAVTLTITNTGDASSGAVSGSLTGAAPDAFRITGGTCMAMVLSPDATCTIEVRMQPSTVGMKSATLQVSATPGGMVSVQLSGIAVAPAAIQLSPTPAMFGTVAAGASASQTLTVQNTGGVTTGTLSFMPTGTDAALFTITGGTCTTSTTLDADATCTLTVTFAPTTRGAKSAMLAVTATPGGTATGGLVGTATQNFTLTVNKTGSTGAGTVASGTVGNINCDTANTDCSEVYTVGVTAPTEVLTATASSGSRFGGFSGGDCTTSPCTVTIDASKTVTASFIQLYNLALTITSVGSGTGSVTSTSNPNQANQLNCTSGTCNQTFDTGTTVTLAAMADAGSTFSGWTGACGGVAGSTCMVTMSQARTVGATFTKLHTLTVTKTGTGMGLVTSSPGAISCGATCMAQIPHGTQVTLTSATTGGNAFLGWAGGGCSGLQAQCSTTVTSNTTIVAKFEPPIYATWDPVYSGPGVTYSSNDLSISMPNGTTTRRNVRSMIGKSSGKWYWEVLANSGSAALNGGGLGVMEARSPAGASYIGGVESGLSFGYGPANTQYYMIWTGAQLAQIGANNNVTPPTGSAVNAGNRYMFALDMDTKRLWVGMNDVWFHNGNPAAGTNPTVTGLSGTVFAGVSLYVGSTNSFTANFGASTFTYTVPTGFNPGLYGHRMSWDPGWSSAGSVFQDMDLSVSGNTLGVKNVRTVSGKTSGKWYWELKISDANANANGGGIGIVDANMPSTVSYIGVGGTGNGNGLSFGYGEGNETLWFLNWPGVTSVSGNPPTGSQLAPSTFYNFALDLGTGQLWVGKDGAWWNGGDPAAGTNPAFTGIPNASTNGPPAFPGVTLYQSSANAVSGNFGVGINGTRPQGFAPLIH